MNEELNRLESNIEQPGDQAVDELTQLEAEQAFADDQAAEISPLPIWGDKSNFNINNLLKENIHLSQYYKDLFRLQTFEEMLEEVDEKVEHAEPWAHAASAIPSSMFCCLLRMLTMRLSLSQIRILMEWRSNSYVRVIGFLYLRYVGDPSILWNNFRHYLRDQTRKFLTKKLTPSF